MICSISFSTCWAMWRILNSSEGAEEVEDDDELELDESFGTTNEVKSAVGFAD